SPLFHVGADAPPVLFIGSSEPRFSAGRDDMVARLAEQGVASSVMLMPDTPHSFWLFDPWLAPTFDAMLAFLNQHLGRPHVLTPWIADLGNGSYQNPVLHADYSDPDVVRVGEMFYMTSSSFSNVPGLPLLQSPDLVNWTLVGHALPQLVPAVDFTRPQPGKGVWAPCLRYHDGKFWIFYPDPDNGIYVMSADHFAGPWSAPRLLLAGRGIIDPAPLWDDDGQAYLVHGWAKSRAGINNRLTLRTMTSDGRAITGAARVIIDGQLLPGYTTLEGPKLYKRDGYYYVFAPAGGVEIGWQSVFRSRRIEGPYEDRIVMAQGSTGINGPHQGAWVTAPDGHDWFIHFQDKRAYGRVVHLQPMQWNDGWPLIGAASSVPGVGQPVATFAKPVASVGAIAVPTTSDEFSSQALVYQWQWDANWEPSWYSLSARPGFLRLYAQAQRPVLSQKLPAPSFTVEASVALHAKAAGDTAGLIMNGLNYAWLGVRASQLVYAQCSAGVCKEASVAQLPIAGAPVVLRMQVGEGGVTRFWYSLDQRNFAPAGTPFTATMGRWVGAQIGLFSSGAPGAWADVDYFRVTR
ncbi:MAG: family 43 glycosylhydrolase, partial [Massilia sp.]